MKAGFIAVFILVIPLSLYSAPERRLTWEPVAGASGYNIEIRDADNNVVLDTSVDVNYFILSKLEPGVYSFRIATLNILRQKGNPTPWMDFTIEKLFIPELKSVSRPQLLSSHINKNVVVTGKNFKPGCRLLLRGNGKEIDLPDIQVNSDSEVIFSFKPDSTIKGRYDLVIINRGDAEAVLKDSIEIVEPETAETIYYAGAGYMINVPFGTWSDYYALSYTGIIAYFQVSGRNYGFENNLLEIELDAVRYSSLTSLRKSTLSYAALGIGTGYYYPVVPESLEIFIKFLGGGVYTSVTFDDDPSAETAVSIDLYLMAGAGVRAYLSDTLFVNSTCSWKTIFYAEEFLNETGISFDCGMKF